MQLADSRLSEAEYGPDFLHGQFFVIVERDQLFFPFRQRVDRPDEHLLEITKTFLLEYVFLCTVGQDFLDTGGKPVAFVPGVVEREDGEPGIQRQLFPQFPQ